MAIQIAAADYHLRSSQALGLRSSDNFTITCWINADWSTTSRRSFVGLYGPATDSTTSAPIAAVQIGTGSSGNELTFWTWGGATLATAITMSNYVNKWCFVAYSFDGTYHRGYVNGALVCTGSTAPVAAYLNQVYINGYPTGGTAETSSFQVDQYALYRRTLSSDELLTMYNSNGGRHGITKDIIARYEFDELSEGSICATVPDLTGNGNTLTSVGSSTAFTYTYINTSVNSNIRVVQ